MKFASIQDYLCNYAFNEYLLNTYCVPGLVTWIKIVEKKIVGHTPPKELSVEKRRQKTKEMGLSCGCDPAKIGHPKSHEARQGRSLISRVRRGLG